jgi:hypothetical protein
VIDGGGHDALRLKAARASKDSAGETSDRNWQRTPTEQPLRMVLH